MIPDTRYPAPLWAMIQFDPQSRSDMHEGVAVTALQLTPTAVPGDRMTKQSLTMIAGCLAALIQSSHDASAMPISAADPAAVVAITAPSQQGTAGSPVSVPPGVLVRDASNNPVSGVTVVFVVIS